MNNIYLFDVDGTLTPAKSKIDRGFKNNLRDWIEGKEVYIISGGTFPRLIDQLSLEIIEMTSGIFPCMGNIFHQKRQQSNDNGYSEWDTIYENKFVAPRNLVRSLNSIVAKSEFPIKASIHHEKRTGMMNFSIVGINADKELRKEYEEWDADKQERKSIVQKLSDKYPSLDFVIGGAVSIDIFNKGGDKSQVIERHLKEAIEYNQIHFVGDRIAFPGNDYSLAQVLKQHPNGEAYEVESWRDTAKLLKTPPFTS